jgi:hypothetical protein
MRERESGLLVWVGSGITRAVPPFLGPYSAGKAAFDAFAEATAWDVAVCSIETRIVMLGVFTEGTEHFAKAEGPADAERAAECTRLRRFLESSGERRVAARALAARRPASRAHSHGAEVGPLRLGRGRDASRGRVHGQGRRQERRRYRACPPPRRRGGRADEGVLARAGRRAEGGTGGMSTTDRGGAAWRRDDDRARRLAGERGQLRDRRRERCARGALGSWRRRRRRVAPPRRGRAGDVHVPGSGRQPLPSRRARLKIGEGQAAALGRGGLPETRSGHRTLAAYAASRSASSRGRLSVT